MAYTPQTWADLPATTTSLSAARMTNIENGLAAAAAVADNAIAASGVAPTVTTKTASFTLTAADAGDILECNSPSGITCTVPTIASAPTMPVGALIELDQVGAGQVTVVGAAGVTLRTPLAPAGTKTRGQWSSISLRRRNTGGTPLTTTNLLARYNADSISGADSSAVASWPESSGLGLPAAAQATGANQPLLRTGANGLGGHNAVQFDGSNDFLSLSGTALALAQSRSNLLVFIAYKLPTAAVTVGPRTLFSLSNGTSSAQNRLNVSTHIATTLLPQAGGRRLDADGFGSVSGASPLTTAKQGILTAKFDWGNRVVTLYDDGTSIATTSTFQTAGATSNTASLAGAIGAQAAGATEFGIGLVAEILVYETADATGTVRANVHSYLYGTYGGSNVPADFAGVADEWVITGDSST